MEDAANASTGTIVFAVIFYSACSSMMIIANKLSVKSLPYPSMVASIQLTFCMFVVMGIKFLKIRPVDDFVWSKIKPYMVRRIASRQTYPAPPRVDRSAAAARLSPTRDGIR